MAQHNGDAKMKIAICRTRLIRDGKTVVMSWLKEDCETIFDAENHVVISGGTRFGCSFTKTLYDDVNKAREALMAARVIHTTQFYPCQINAVSVSDEPEYPVILTEEQLKNGIKLNAKNSNVSS